MDDGQHGKALFGIGALGLTIASAAVGFFSEGSMQNTAYGVSALSGYVCFLAFLGALSSDSDQSSAKIRGDGETHGSVERLPDHTRNGSRLKIAYSRGASPLSDHDTSGSPHVRPSRKNSRFSPGGSDPSRYVRERLPAQHTRYSRYSRSLGPDAQPDSEPDGP